MLSQNDLSLLYKIVSDKSQTFEDISKLIKTKFNSDSQIKAAASLLILLEDNLLTIHQRIISYFILYVLSNNEKMETNPYLSFILERLGKSNDKIEQSFLIDFLCRKINYLNLTIDNYLKNNPKEQRINTTQIQMQWDKYYKETLRKKNIKIKKDDINRPIIYDAKNVAIKNINNKPNNNILGHINNDKNNFNLNCYKANYMICFPVNSVFISNEPIWILPYLSHNYIWEKK